MPFIESNTDSTSTLINIMRKEETFKDSPKKVYEKKKV